MGWRMMPIDIDQAQVTSTVDQAIVSAIEALKAWPSPSHKELRAGMGRFGGFAHKNRWISPD
jgi:hypothetical protein